MERGDEFNYEVQTDAGFTRGNGGRPPVPPGGLYQREQRFVTALLEVIQGRPLTDAVLLEAARHSLRTKAHTEPKRTHELLTKAKMIMNFPNVRAHLLDLFERAAEFSPEEAAKAHVKHIREGNYQALKDYWGMTLEKEPVVRNVKAAVLNVTPAEFEKSRAPKPIAARRLGDDEPPGEEAE